METIKQYFQVDRKEINYLRVIIESYDGMAVLRTVDPHRAIIELQISPGCISFISDLLDDLRAREGLSIKNHVLETQGG